MSFPTVPRTTIRGLARLGDSSDAAALVAWASGNAIEAGLLTTLAAVELKRRSIAGVVRLVSPLAVERGMVAALDGLVDRDRPKRRSRRPGKLAPSSSSFPSGHASNAFLVTTLLDGTVSRRVGYGVAAFVSVTRLVTGVHRPSDVVAGAIAGMAIGGALNEALPPER